MATFKDMAGREWSVSITAAHMKVVRETLGVHLGKLLDDGFALLRELLGDPIQLIDVVWLLVKGQHPDVSDVQFGEALGGDAKEDLERAFVGSVSDFSPRRLRKPLLAMVAKSTEVSELAADLMTTQVNALNAQAVMKPPTSNASAGNSPASSESTPAT